MPGPVRNPQHRPEASCLSIDGAYCEGLAPSPDRWNRGAWLSRDSTLHGFEILLDEAFRIPGTEESASDWMALSD